MTRWATAPLGVLQGSVTCGVKTDLIPFQICFDSLPTLSRLPVRNFSLTSRT